ncbi:cysteine-rich receptor-like protein kinase 26 [Vigna umbellata]|uniref:cysteine-rich receptor-like protein kinase 26 n=1 Tax=Vigna umbellata TaxID=87088 RepID=UPI001F5EE499|nr:cysteine-rich receptor-like protein kinase 26 [Vigna umbellata]
MTAIFCLLGLCATIIISHASAQTPFCDNSKGNYTVNSAYHNNLNTLLSSFSTRAQVNYGFYSSSHGQGLDKAHAIGICSGYLTPEECLKCLNENGAALTKNCPNQKEAIVWDGECSLRYSNRSMHGLMENQPTVLLYYTLEVKGSIEQFNVALQSLMRNLTRIAASGDSRHKYATGSAPAPYFQTIYGYTQCSPDLSSEDCSKCLEESISKIPDCCKGKAGGNVLKPSCRIRFDPYIYDGPSPYSSYPGTTPYTILINSIAPAELN